MKLDAPSMLVQLILYSHTTDTLSESLLVVITRLRMRKMYAAYMAALGCGVSRRHLLAYFRTLFFTEVQEMNLFPT